MIFATHWGKISNCNSQNLKRNRWKNVFLIAGLNHLFVIFTKQRPQSRRSQQRPGAAARFRRGHIFSARGEAKTRQLISSGSRGLSDYRPISSLREEACRALPHDLILTHCVLITATFILTALTSVFPTPSCTMVFHHENTFRHTFQEVFSCVHEIFTIFKKN